MNLAEYKALFAAPDIGHVERTLYLYLRWHMDFKSGVVGQSRRISYQGIAEHLEVLPVIGSTMSVERFSRDQVKRLLNKLISRGWIEPLHRKRNNGPVSMVFKLALANSDLLGAEEERQRSATGAPRHSPHSARVFDFPKGAKVGEERHTSDLSVKEDIYTREDLVFCEQFKGMALQAQLVVSDVELTGYFDSFKFSTKDDGAFKPLYVHLKAWRQYCVSIRNNLSKNGGNNEISKSGVGDGEPKSATARTILRGLERYKNSYEGQWDEIG